MAMKLAMNQLVGCSTRGARAQALQTLQCARINGWAAPKARRVKARIAPHVLCLMMLAAGSGRDETPVCCPQDAIASR
jgi:hypothetical protein